MTADIQLRQDVVDELEFEPSIDAARVKISGHVHSFQERSIVDAQLGRLRGFASCRTTAPFSKN